MKKAIRIFLVLSLALSLSSAMVGCGSSSTAQNTASQSGTQTDTSGQAASGESAPEQNSQSKDPEYTLGKIVLPERLKPLRQKSTILIVNFCHLP